MAAYFKPRTVINACVPQAVSLTNWASSFIEWLNKVSWFKLPSSEHRMVNHDAEPSLNSGIKSMHVNVKMKTDITSKPSCKTVTDRRWYRLALSKVKFPYELTRAHRIKNRKIMNVLLPLATTKSSCNYCNSYSRWLEINNCEQT